MICSTFGQCYIALDQSVFVPFYFISVPNCDIMFWVFILPLLGKGYLSFILCPLLNPGALNGFCLLGKTIPRGSTHREANDNCLMAGYLKSLTEQRKCRLNSNFQLSNAIESFHLRDQRPC